VRLRQDKHAGRSYVGHNEGLQELYSPPDNARVIKSGGCDGRDIQYAKGYEECVQNINMETKRKISLGNPLVDGIILKWCEGVEDLYDAFRILMNTIMYL
jgi:hypothetical protein